MAVRTTMLSLIARTRLLIGDTTVATQVFADQDVQDVLDGRRMDIVNGSLTFQPTFSGSTIQYLDYFSEWSDWEDTPTLKQYLVTTVTPSVSENIVGHWQFAASTFPPVFITGHTYCIYGAAADLLERWAARYMTRFNFASDSQSFQVSQVPRNMQLLARGYRMQQRAISITTRREDANIGGSAPSLDAQPVDYMASG